MLPPDAADPTRTCIREAYAAYYRRARLRVRDPETREWMLTFQAGDGEVVERYRKFPTEAALLAEAMQRTPKGVFHSVCSYQALPSEDLPAERALAALKRNIVYSEPVIDVDRKVSEGYRNLSEALEAAKLATAQILAILDDELGIRPPDYELAFSGSKGFHIRLVAHRFLHLKPQQRLDFANYLTGNNAHVERLFRSQIRGEVFFPFDPAPSGFVGRVHRGLEYLRRFAGGELPLPDDLEAHLRRIVEKHDKNTGYTAQEILDNIARAKDLNALMNSSNIIRNAAWDIAREWSSPGFDVAGFNHTVGQARTPGTINGKTGLLCTPLDPRRLLDFDPMLDANPYPRGDALYVRGRNDRAITAAGETYHIHKDANVRLPAHLAMVFLCSGQATLIPSLEVVA